MDAKPKFSSKSNKNVPVPMKYKNDESCVKVYPEGPQIHGSKLLYSTSTNSSFKTPEDNS